MSEFKVTENGAVVLSTTGKALLDLNFAVSSYRKASPAVIMDAFIKAYDESPELAVKWAFYAGDIRRGLGERRLFRIILPFLITRYPFLVKYVGFYNRFDSLLELLSSPETSAYAIDRITTQLMADKLDMESGKPISLLAKWMPSINTTSDVTRSRARVLAKAIFPGKDCYKRYRQTLSKFRKYLNVVETKMCNCEWGDINYEAVPSKANLRYADAFLSHDKERRNQFIKALADGKAKVNAGTLFPHDVLVKYKGKDKQDTLLESMWTGLPYTQAEGHSMLVVRDGSGSMYEPLSDGSSVMAVDVATALTIYFAEHAAGPYKDKFITFSRESEVVDLSGCNSLYEKMNECNRHGDISNTNLELVFDRILKIAVDNHLAQSDIPDLLIVSDMEFDDAACGYGYGRTDKKQTLFDTIAEKYSAAGYKLPKLVFWNINSRTRGIPVAQNENGVVLLSGYSVNSVNMVMTGKLDPYEALLDVLNSGRYAPITTKNCDKDV